MILGSDLLAALDRRAKGGLPFGFNARQELRSVESLEGVSEFLQSGGFGAVPRSAEGVTELADFVFAVSATRSWRAMRRGGMTRMLIDVLILIAGWSSSGSIGIAALTFGGLLCYLDWLASSF